MRELQILTPDGKRRKVSLEGECLSVGRSNTAEICYPEDTGLSRQHLALERDGDGWAVRDLGSKNGTMVNGTRIAARIPLKPGDRISAGHLILIYDNAPKPLSKPLVVFDPQDAPDRETRGTVATSLADVIHSNPAMDGGGQILASAQISALIQAGNELALQRPLPELFEFILDLSLQAVTAERGILMILENEELIVRANKGEGFRISTAVRDRVLNTGKSLLVRDATLDEAFKERRSIVGQNVRTLMAVPLQTRDQIIGLIYLDSPSVLRRFTVDDLNLLTVMANVAAIRIEHMRLAEIEQARKLMARDLEQAAEIQQGILPACAPKIRGLDVAGHNSACRTVGGDYYDFFPYPSNRLAMVLGDVSGKGMPASLLMMGLQARMQVLIEEPHSLADVMTRLNRITSANCPANRFITLFLCILHAESGELCFCNAGHNPPLIIRANGKVEKLKGGGPVIGIIPAAEYEEQTARLDMGDSLVIYSDGVTEATSPDGEEFDMHRLGETVARNRTQPARDIVEAVNQAVDDFTGGAPQSDDITMIVARRISA